MNSYSPFAKHYINGDNQMTTSVNQFEDNYHGILTHNGEIKVAKCDVEQTILHIDDYMQNFKGNRFSIPLALM